MRRTAQGWPRHTPPRPPPSAPPPAPLQVTRGLGQSPPLTSPADTRPHRRRRRVSSPLAGAADWPSQVGARTTADASPNPPLHHHPRRDEDALHSQFFPQRGPNQPSMKANSSLDVLAPSPPSVPNPAPSPHRMELRKGLKPRTQPCVERGTKGRKALPWCTARTLTFDTTARGARRELCGAAAPAYISYHLPADRAMRAEENHTRDNPAPSPPAPSIAHFLPAASPPHQYSPWAAPFRHSSLRARDVRGSSRIIELDLDPGVLCLLLSVGQAIAVCVWSF
mmetsp:Transcript_11296/g.35721  ORF Transcript_11296/g.35721 Transcript_11296/m.35721 type:complete len:281 (-) Transcript_11296:54-896(-)